MMPRLPSQWIFAASSVLWSFGLGLFLYIQPLYVAELGASPAQIGWALGLAGLLVLCLYVPIGWWADRRGRKPVIVAGWALGALATLAMALAPDWRWFIPAHAGYLLSDFAMPAYYGYIAVDQAGGKLNRTFALITGAAAVGSVVSPAVGGWVAAAFGLRAVYGCAAVVFGLSTLVLTRLRRQPTSETTPSSPKPAQRAGMGAGGLGAANEIAGRFGALRRHFWWQIAILFLVFLALGLGQVMLPKYLADVRGLSVQQLGWLGTLGSLGIMTQTLLLGLLPDERRIALLLAQVAALSAFALLLGSAWLPVIALAYLLHGSNRVVRPFLIGRLARSLAPATMSLGYGFQQTAMQLAWSIASLAAGHVYAQNPSWPLTAGLIGLLISAGLTLSLPRLQPAPTHPVLADS